jgi:hypothetical protein
MFSPRRGRRRLCRKLKHISNPSLCPSPHVAQPYGLNDTIGCLLDCEGGSLAFTKNGRPLGPAFELPQVGKAACLSLGA